MLMLENSMRLNKQKKQNNNVLGLFIHEGHSQSNERFYGFQIGYYTKIGLMLIINLSIKTSL